jgi:hypothetical protein
MRPRIVIVIALVVIPALYLISRPGPRDERAVRAPLPIPPAEAGERPRGQSAAQDQARDGIHARLSELEGRLVMLEQAPAPAEEPPPAPTLRIDLGEGDIAKWMDDQLHALPDATASQQATAELTATIAAVERRDLHVENVSCAERFCRASFYQDNGELPVVTDLYGAPPLTGEGFTLQEPNGRLGVYFARNGERVSDFRNEALLASAP